MSSYRYPQSTRGGDGRSDRCRDRDSRADRDRRDRHWYHDDRDTDEKRSHAHKYESRSRERVGSHGSHRDFVGQDERGHSRKDRACDTKRHDHCTLDKQRSHNYVSARDEHQCQRTSADKSGVGVKPVECSGDDLEAK